MRIACVHIPQLSLQCATRLDPSLRGAAIAVVGGGEGKGPLQAPIVLACSRAAWALGVRLGMTATAARGLSHEVKIVPAELAIERETVRAIADALLAVTGLVDLGGRVGVGGAHLAMYAEVPAKTRGASFGERVLDLLDELGLTGRVGIADDRFTAWVAAAHAGSPHDERGVIAVPRGGSAAFLAPRPLSLLAITPEVQHMLESLGVRTLGEFAALPAPSVARPLEADYQALARGDGGTALRPYAPEAPIREDIVVTAGGVLDGPGSLSGPAAVALVARRIALRLAGRGRGAAKLEVFAGDREVPVAAVAPVTIEHAVTEAEEVARVLAPAMEVAPASAWRLRAVVIGEAIADGKVIEPAEFAQSVHVDGTAPPFGGAAGRAQVPAVEATISPLAVVLATSGSVDLFTGEVTPATLRAERRDAHRRTRRGKQRRSRPAPLAQSRLFDRGSS